jgi:hypothetical protein
VGVGCGCTSVVSLSPAKNDFLLGPFDMKNGFDVKCKNPKKSFCHKNGFSPLITSQGRIIRKKSKTIFVKKCFFCIEFFFKPPYTENENTFLFFLAPFTRKIRTLF